MTRPRDGRTGRGRHRRSLRRRPPILEIAQDREPDADIVRGSERGADVGTVVQVRPVKQREALDTHERLPHPAVLAHVQGVDPVETDSDIQAVFLVMYEAQRGRAIY